MKAQMKAQAGEKVRISLMNTTTLQDWEELRKSPVMMAGIKRGT
jgi:hypothetical protein